MVVIAVVAFSHQGHASEGVSDSTIVIGQSAALDGPAARLGLDMKAGMDAAFHVINANGGIHNRQIELISMDDGYNGTMYR